jgi:hypothetical protein
MLYTCTEWAPPPDADAHVPEAPATSATSGHTAHHKAHDLRKWLRHERIQRDPPNERMRDVHTSADLISQCDLADLWILTRTSFLLGSLPTASFTCIQLVSHHFSFLLRILHILIAS